jgi:hypothetical protein
MTDIQTQLATALDRSWPAIVAVAENSPDQARLLADLAADPSPLIGVTMWAGALVRRISRMTATAAGTDPSDPADYQAALRFVTVQLAAEAAELATVARFADGVDWPRD